MIRDETHLPRLAGSDRKPTYIIPRHCGPHPAGCYLANPASGTCDLLVGFARAVPGWLALARHVFRHVGPHCGWDAHSPLCWARVPFLKSPDPCVPLSQTRPLSVSRLQHCFASRGRRAKLQATCASQDDGARGHGRQGTSLRKVCVHLVIFLIIS